MNLSTKIGTACLWVCGALPAQAFTNLGFDDGNTSGWTVAAPGMLEAHTDFTVSIGQSNFGINPIGGDYFGLLTTGLPQTNALASFASNLDLAMPYSGAEALWLRFLSPELKTTQFNDTAVVFYVTSTGSSGVLASLTVNQYAPDSNWLQYTIPTGTTFLGFSLSNVSTAGTDNRGHSYLAIDLAPVPEPPTPALVLAGIAVMAFLSRRRMRR